MAAKKTYTKKEPTVRVPFVPSYPPSSEQEVIFKDIVDNDSSIHIEASPGSGKSTTLKWAMTKDRTPSKGLRAGFAAFSAAIVKEIEPGCASNVDVRTFHSFGYQALSKKYGRLNMYDNKVQHIFKELYPSLDPDEMKGEERTKAYNFMFDFLKLVNLLRANLLDENDPANILRICQQYNIELDIGKSLDIIKPIYARMVENPSIIDFTDMMWLPIRLNLEIQKYPMMYVDERQDLNSLMIEYVLRMSSERIMTVGDECQSIFGFSGSDIHSTKRLVAAFGGIERPLNVCYRCGTDIVKLAQTIYPKILPFDKNPTGDVEHRGDLDWDMPDGSMVLSRRNANLVRPCFAFLRRGRKAVIKGRDIGSGILKLVKSMKAKDVFDLMDKIRIHKQQRIEKLMGEKSINQSMIQRVEDECDCVIEIAQGCDSLAEMESHIEKIFSESTQGITLSSIHRSKGLEADMVSIVDYTRIRLNHDKMTPEDHIQEKNLHFVAVTRAKKVLHLIDETFRDE